MGLLPGLNTCLLDWGLGAWEEYYCWSSPLGKAEYLVILVAHFATVGYLATVYQDTDHITS